MHWFSLAGGGAAAYLCKGTFWTMRQRLIDRGLDTELFESTAKKLAKLFGVDTSFQRLDSTHPCSIMRHLGRIGLSAATITRFLVNLRSHQRVRFAELAEELIGRYVKRGFRVAL